MSFFVKPKWRFIVAITLLIVPLALIWLNSHHVKQPDPSQKYTSNDSPMNGDENKTSQNISTGEEGELGSSTELERNADSSSSSVVDLNRSGSKAVDDLDMIPASLRANIEQIRKMDPDERAPDRLIIGFKKAAANAAPDLPESASHRGLHQRIGTELIHEYSLISACVVKVPEGMSLLETATHYAKDPSVEYIDADVVIYPSSVPNDPSYPNLWGMKRIRADEVWNISTGSKAVKVAVCDTGISTHSDLTANRWVNPGESGLDAMGRNKASNGVDDEGNGFIDDVHGWGWYEDENWISHDSNAFPDDGSGHGTHVSGTIGAVGNNGIGVTGVNWNTQIVPLKFLHGGRGYLSNLVKCINYATQNDCRVVNISAGGAGITFTTLKNAILAAGDAGVLIVSAAGNSQADAATQTPANSGSEKALVVGAIGPDGKKAYYSNYSTSIVHLGAPGGNQKSPFGNSDGIQSTYLNNGYRFYQGTSMATPHVAGAAALLWSVYPDATLEEIRNAILQGARKNSNLVSWFQEGRELDVMGAQEYLSKIQVNTSVLAVNEGGSTQISVSLKAAPTTPVTITVQKVSGSDNLYLPVVPSMVFTSSNWNVPQLFNVKSKNDENNEDDSTRFLIKGPIGIGGISVDINQIDTLGVPVFTTNFMPEAEVGKPFIATVSATSARALSLSVGSIPSWLQFQDNGNGTASLSGIPTEIGIQNVIFTASDGVWNTDKSLTLFVSPALDDHVMIDDTFTTSTGAWFKGGMNGNLSQSDGQLHWQESGNNMEEVIGRSFPEVTLAVGQKIRLSFNYRQIGTGSIMRAGLHDVTHPISADNWAGANAIGAWKGYYSFVRDNSSSSNETRRESGSTTSLSTGPTVGYAVISSANTTLYNLNDNGSVNYHCVFEATYVSPTQMDTLFTLSSTTGGVNTVHFSIRGTTSTIYNKFDTVTLRYSSGSMVAAYDNVRVETFSEISGPIASTFSEWTELIWPGVTNPTITGMDKDPDGDGMNNLMEWALHLDPIKSDTFQPNFLADQTALNYTYTRRKTAPGEAEYIVEWSDTLNDDWSTEGVVLSAPVSLDETSDSVTATIPRSPIDRRFIRVKIVKP